MITRKRQRREAFVVIIAKSIAQSIMIPGTQLYAAVCFRSRFLHPFDLSGIACPSRIMASTNSRIQRNRMNCSRIDAHKPQPQEEESIKISRKQKIPQRQKRRVSFGEGVLVYMDKRRQKDRQAMFYSPDEMALFIKDVLSETEKHQIAKAEDEERCLLGLEHHFLNETYKQKQKLKAVLAVLMEQNRQYKEEGHFTPVDDERMSTCYRRVSITSHKEAHERGLKHFDSRSEESQDDSVTDVMEPSHSPVSSKFSFIPVSPYLWGAQHRHSAPW
jgi:hypothetical protein